MKLKLCSEQSKHAIKTCSFSHLGPLPHSVYLSSHSHGNISLALLFRFLIPQTVKSWMVAKDWSSTTEACGLLLAKTNRVAVVPPDSLRKAATAAGTSSGVWFLSHQTGTSTKTQLSTGISNYLTLVIVHLLTHFHNYVSKLFWCWLCRLYTLRWYVT